MKHLHVQPTSGFSFSRRRLCGAVALVMALAVSEAQAAPEGGSVVGGQGSISNSDGDTTIIQSSDRLAIDWDSFSIADDERVEFIQPTSDAIALNRVLGNDASRIFGQLEANGQVILVNPNGVLFGESATVNVAGLVASGLDIDPNDFINGDLIFTAGSGSGVVINRGLINAATGGNVALLGKRVANEGLISAELGSVALAAGQAAVLTFDPQGLVGVRVSKEILQRQLGAEAAVSNSGTIEAASGRVLLTASASQDVFSQAVNSGELSGATQVQVLADGSFVLGRGAKLVNTGEIDVSSRVGIDDVAGSDQALHGGAAVLLADTITHSGEIKANSTLGDAGEVVIAGSTRTRLRDNGTVLANADTATGGSGGTVTLLGRQVGLTHRAEVRADGNSQGGHITLGADLTDSASRLKDSSFVFSDRSTRVSAIGTLDGGAVNSFARDQSRITGSLDVSGDTGGSIHILSAGRLAFDGNVSMAGFENAGELVLAGQDLSVTAARSLFTISEASINRALASGSVTLQASGNLRVGSDGAPVSLVAVDDIDSFDLTLSAGATLDLAQSEILLGRGNLALLAGGSDADLPAAIVLDGAALATNGSLSLISEGDIHGQSVSLGLSHDAMVARSPQTVAFTAGENISLSFDEDVSTDALLELSAGGDIKLAANSFRPNLAIAGRDVLIDSIWGFHSDLITAENLTLTTIGQVEATAKVSGTTHFFGTADANYSLSGDFNVLSGETGYLSVVNIQEENDLVLGDLLMLDADVAIVSSGEGAVISQAENSQLTIGSTIMSLQADNVALGAAGTSSVLVSEGYFLVTANNVDINGLIDFSGYFEEVFITAGSITYGEFADIRPSEFGETADDFPDTGEIIKQINFGDFGIR